ncbi:MAG: hypothetical protein ACLUDU_04460 [Butyricimonas faecihominis]
MVKRIYCAWMLVAAFAMTGCESLEDTYSDYAGDGMIRYVGRCRCDGNARVGTSAYRMEK